ncbi:hypothetical protein J4429_05595 [Candidatus Pacearchaeota archaeon]|nr:hypothetical protein [Candidatus Pacearchaeota archaeon]
MLELLQYISIGLETIIAVIGLMILFQKKKEYGFYIFITFAIYAFYNFAKQFNFANTEILYILFFIATVSMFYGVLKLFKDNEKNSIKIKNTKNRRKK